MSPANYPHPYLEFAQLFNEQKFFEAHEVLELLWREEKGDARDFYHGLIQIAAAFVHIQKGTPDGAQKLFQTAAQYLKKYPSIYLGLDLKKLIDETQASLLTQKEFPKIRLSH